ncbi:hypothetical protein Psuf_065930 [Phytohabitans suffuscus]|uniref:Uncharacterized protein n=1 Tax=Phytohabitans suffuscus TaxID=624315 RepID=A0A6F8YT00_9ACTN|nr:hypothetical protein Psuf_065930 [Phytohabitans suffuscus]
MRRTCPDTAFTANPEKALREYREAQALGITTRSDGQDPQTSRRLGRRRRGGFVARAVGLVVSLGEFGFQLGEPRVGGFELLA